MKFEGKETTVIQTFSCDGCGLEIYISEMEDPEFIGEPNIRCKNCLSLDSKKTLNIEKE